ncbi:hypothetical protein N4T20_01630 [Flavobacterium sp. TR2]|uniref:hypothetical protein n=1 Tax=Flavobacterium sp. TR2 TaxID=2977321 RepID=UPI0021B13527|nr:hypothetical protein [Flavobacterium sp. TR2]UWY28635.1 hypothetical protein N4T20_01630 [Flavobacterium sp. TR2]
MNFTSFKYIVFIVLLYLFVYNPPFQGLPVSPVEIMIIPAVLYIIISWKWYSTIKIFKVETFLFFLIIFFSYLRDFERSESVFFKANVLLFLESIVIPSALLIFYSKLKNGGNLFKEIVFVGGIAAFITFFLIFVPPLNLFVKNVLLQQNEFSEFIAFRSFGLSEGLTFAFGVVQGLVFAFAFYFSRTKSKYLILLPFLLLSIFFNARSGLIPVVFILVYFVILKFNFKFIGVSFLIGFLFYLILFQTPFFKEYAQTLEWAFDFFVQTSDFFTGKADNADVNTFSTLFGDMVVLPQNLTEWLIGSGDNVFLFKTGNSDVGYIIQLNYGGVIYLFLIVLLISHLILRLKFLNRNHRWFVLMLLFTIVIGNVKGLFISVNANFRLIMLMYCYLIFEYRKGINHINSLFVA